MPARHWIGVLDAMVKADTVYSPGYDFNDSNLPIGAAYCALLAERYLQP